MLLTVKMGAWAAQAASMAMDCLEARRAPLPSSSSSSSPAVSWGHLGHQRHHPAEGAADEGNGGGAAHQLAQAVLAEGVVAGQLLGRPDAPVRLTADPALPAGLRPRRHAAPGQRHAALVLLKDGGGWWPCPGRWRLNFSPAPGCPAAPARLLLRCPGLPWSSGCPSGPESRRQSQPSFPPEVRNGWMTNPSA